MQARETNARRAEDRKRSVLVLAQRFLLEHNMPDSARALEREGGVPLKTFDAADNASLTHVLAEWEALHEERFGFRPKLTRRADDPKPGSSAAALAATKGKAGAKAGAERRAARIAAEREASRSAVMGTGVDEDASNLSVTSAATGDVLPSDFDVPPGHPSLRRYASDGVAKPAGGTTLSNAMDYVAKRDAERRGDVAPSGTEHLGKTHSESHLDAGGYRGFMNGHQSKHATHVNGVGEAEGGGAEGGAESNDDGDDGIHIPGAWEERQRVLKPPPTFGGSVELRDLARVITRDIYTSNPDVRFKDISGCDEAKRLLKEAVVMPVKYPQFFHGLLRPWRGILLYGPPGTGKTMLAKAVATECGTTFFNISASSVVSKWRGDSEKLVRVLFELARHHAPSTVFMDELDAVMSARDGGGSGGSSSGCGDHDSSRRLKTELLVQMDGLNRDEGELVFLLAATNLPWELDPAMLRRLEKRIHVGLPGEDARRRMMSRYLEPHDVAADVDLAALAAKTDGYSGADVMLLCKEGAMRPLRRLMERLNDDLEPAGFGTDEEVTVGEITGDDIVGALSATRPTQTEAHAKRYVEWTNSFGAVL